MPRVHVFSGFPGLSHISTLYTLFKQVSKTLEKNTVRAGLPETPQTNTYTRFLPITLPEKNFPGIRGYPHPCCHIPWGCAHFHIFHFSQPYHPPGGGYPQVIQVLVPTPQENVNLGRLCKTLRERPVCAGFGEMSSAHHLLSTHIFFSPWGKFSITISKIKDILSEVFRVLKFQNFCVFALSALQNKSFSSHSTTHFPFSAVSKTLLGAQILKTNLFKPILV